MVASLTASVSDTGFGGRLRCPNRRQVSSVRHALSGTALLGPTSGHGASSPCLYPMSVNENDCHSHRLSASVSGLRASMSPIGGTEATSVNENDCHSHGLSMSEKTSDGLCQVICTCSRDRPRLQLGSLAPPTMSPSDRTAIKRLGALNRPLRPGLSTRNFSSLHSYPTLHLLFSASYT